MNQQALFAENCWNYAAAVLSPRGAVRSHSNLESMNVESIWFQLINLNTDEISPIWIYL